MVGIVVVSHSRALARAAVALATEMVPGQRPSIAVAAGLDDETFGTDAVAVRAAIEEVDAPDGVVVLCDLGSAVLSAEMALEFLADDVRARVLISPAPLVEGLVVACVTAAGGASATEVASEASNALDAKVVQLGGVPKAVTAEQPDSGPPAASATLLVSNAHGLHARPAARLVSVARGFDARVWLRIPTDGAAAVSASSLSAVATLGARAGDTLELTAWGPDASAARDALVALAARGFDDTAAGTATEPAATSPTPSPASRHVGPVGAAPGLAIGPVHQLRTGRPAIPQTEPGAPDVQRARLTTALALARDDVERSRRQVAQSAGEADAAIFDAHALLLQDPTLLDDVDARITAGQGAARAWDDVMQAAADVLGKLENSYQRARAADVKSVGDQVLRHLVGVPANDSAAAGVVVAADLTPADAAALDRGAVKAVVLANGSPTSHAAILARAYGIPMVTGAGEGVLDLPDGRTVAVDGDSGELLVNPPADAQAAFEERIATRQKAHAVADAAATALAVTIDGTQIAVLANVGSLDDARDGAAAHAEGSGLVRTEFLFVGKTAAPSRDEQEQAYRAIAEAFGGARVVLRTLDVGGDKPLPFAPQAVEANPFLGERGIRLALRHRELFLEQLVAMCRVARDHPISVMFPMVTAVSEVVEAKAVLDAALADVGGERPAALQVGIMVEVPSVALNAAAFVPHVDFFSVGTNDLTQYTLAAERGNGAVAALADGLDPGVLRLIGLLCEGAGSVPVSVCGELAADPLAVPLLLGLGVRSLSVVPPAIATVKQCVRDVDLGRARRLAEKALTCESATEVRVMMNGEDR